MDNLNAYPEFTAEEPLGILLRGILVHCGAKAFQRKDGLGIIVKLTYELAMDGNLARIEEFLNPAEDSRVKLDGLEVTEWPKLPLCARVDYLVERFTTDDGKRLVATKGRFLRVAAPTNSAT